MSYLNFADILKNVKRASNFAELAQRVRPVLQESGFGENASEHDGIGASVQLSYMEIAECLTETDRLHFQKHIEVMVFANQRYKELEAAGGHIEVAPEPNPWEFFT